MGGMALYEATKKPEYLEYTILAAEYFCSWMYYFDVPCVAESDFAQYGYRSTGGTSVSTQHHHIDPWGVLMVPFLMKLARCTGDEKWRQRAKALWFGGTQAIAREDGYVMHGLARMAGSANEAYLQSRWNWKCEAAEPGTFNDWLVAWPGAFRLFTITELEKLDE